MAASCLLHVDILYCALEHQLLGDALRARFKRDNFVTPHYGSSSPRTRGHSWGYAAGKAGCPNDN
jgi:hypothetical protein